MANKPQIFYKCGQKLYDKDFVCPIGKVCYMCSSAINVTEQLTLF